MQSQNSHSSKSVVTTKEQELEAIAASFMSDPANAEALEDEKLWDATIGDGLEKIPA
jgi:hypothetical protein